MEGPVTVELAHAEARPLPRVVRVGEHLTAERVRLETVKPFEFTTTGAVHFLALHDIALKDGFIRLSGGPEVRELDLRKKFTFLPAGVAAVGWCDPLNRANAFTAIHFEAEAIPVSLRASAIFQTAELYFRDHRLETTFSKLGSALRKDDPFLGLLGDTLATLAILEFGLRYQTGARPTRRAPVLSSAQLGRVRDYVLANLARPISLSDLSQVAGLSKFHFLRAFKAATGETPYREVVRLRLDAARALLKDGQSISEAARRCGFSSAPQLARAYRRVLGGSVHDL